MLENSRVLETIFSIASGFAQAGLLANMAQRREIWILKEFLAENDRLFSCAFGGEAPECTDLIVAIFSPRRRYAPLRVAYLRQNLLTWDGWVIWIQTDGKSEFRRMENARFHHPERQFGFWSLESKLSSNRKLLTLLADSRQFLELSKQNLHNPLL